MSAPYVHLPDYFCIQSPDRNARRTRPSIAKVNLFPGRVAQHDQVLPLHWRCSTMRPSMHSTAVGKDAFADQRNLCCETIIFWCCTVGHWPAPRIQHRSATLRRPDSTSLRLDRQAVNETIAYVKLRQGVTWGMRLMHRCSQSLPIVCAIT